MRYYTVTSRNVSDKCVNNNTRFRGQPQTVFSEKSVRQTYKQYDISFIMGAHAHIFKRPNGHILTRGLL